MKPRAFDILILLGDGSRHGWSIVKELQEASVGSRRILPGSLYRTLNQLLEEGLIEEAPDRGESEDARRRYLRLTPLGIDVAREEAARLASVVADARSKKLLFPADAGEQGV